MEKRECKKMEGLIKRSLDSKINSKKRADSFNKLFDEYIKMDKDGDGWDEFRIKLREKFANKFTDKQKVKYGLRKNQLKKSYSQIKNYISKSQKSFFPVELFYEAGFSMIMKVVKKKDKILDIGYGDFPILVNLLNKKGYDAYGIEPFAKKFDKKKTFKCGVKDISKKIKDLKFNLILANMVYSVNYTSHFTKSFGWELGNKKQVLGEFFDLLNDRGILILVDDIGTIFSKDDLDKYFQVLIFEKDIEIRDFDTGKVGDYVRVTILQKR